MVYSQSQIADLRGRIMRKINTEINLAIKNDMIDELIKKYSVDMEGINYLSGVTRKSKILILGQLSGKIKDYQMAAKKLGISEENLEFIDYIGAKQINAERLRYSCEYSDIICGPIPHKVQGMGDTSSLIAEIEKKPNEFPKLIKARANDKLKFSINGFKDYLTRTRFYEEIVEE